MPPAAMVLLVPTSVRPLDAMNGTASSLWQIYAPSLNPLPHWGRGLSEGRAAGLGPTGTGITFMRAPPFVGIGKPQYWDAMTNAERIPRWFLPISADLRLSGRYQL